MDVVGQVVRVDNLRDGYTAIVRAVRDYGEKVAPRGQKTREFQNATIIVNNPFDTLPTGIGRGIVPGIAAVESAQLLAGESRAQLVMNVGPTFANFVEDDGEFWGAYGRRTNGQFEQIEKRLKADAYSRQAHVTIWDHRLDLEDGRKDFPCTVSYTFMLRNDKLHMTTLMRSNDVLLGLGYDGFQHSRVQIAMASVLGVEVGEYRHHAVSLHIYERDFDMVDKLTMSQKEPTFFPAITGKSWAEVKSKAHTVLDCAEAADGTSVNIDESDGSHLQWYVNSMISAIQKNKSKGMS